MSVEKSIDLISMHDNIINNVENAREVISTLKSTIQDMYDEKNIINNANGKNMVDEDGLSVIEENQLTIDTQICECHVMMLQLKEFTRNVYSSITNFSTQVEAVKQKTEADLIRLNKAEYEFQCMNKAMKQILSYEKPEFNKIKLLKGEEYSDLINVEEEQQQLDLLKLYPNKNKDLKKKNSTKIKEEQNISVSIDKKSEKNFEKEEEEKPKDLSIKKESKEEEKSKDLSIKNERKEEEKSKDLSIKKESIDSKEKLSVKEENNQEEETINRDTNKDIEIEIEEEIQPEMKRDNEHSVKRKLACEMILRKRYEHELLDLKKIYKEKQEILKSKQSFKTNLIEKDLLPIQQKLQTIQEQINKQLES
ncbi:hypothetical protein WA158_003098 [Blastocystis sp. Blastoise]